MSNSNVVIGTICSDCGQYCGGFCDNPFASCREACSPCCTASVKMAASLDNIPALTIIGRNETTKLYDEFDPDATDGTELAVGLLVHPVTTDADGKVLDFRSASVQITRGQETALVFTSGEFLESLLVDQNSAALVAAMLAQPNFAKRIAGGYIRIL